MFDPALSALRAETQSALQEFGNRVDERLPAWAAVRDGRAFRQMELEAAAAGRKAADDVMARVLKAIASDADFEAEAACALRATGVFRNGGRRDVSVTLLGGSEVRLVDVLYLRPARRRSGKKRRHGQRGKNGAGVYPLLAALGIGLGVTPALAGEICRQVADSDSVRSGRAALDRRGIDLGHKTTLRIVNGFSTRAAEQRDRWLDGIRNAVGAASGTLHGKRVVMATDGGRLRERKPARNGRRRAATGHRRYDAPWREPKLLTVYVIDEQGVIDENYRAVYDGTLGDCDDLFAMLLGYLKALGAHEATELICLGDGAKWIWERIDALVAALGIDRARVTEVIDWCHAVATLHEISEARNHWASGERESWVRRAKNKLHAGRIDDLLAMIDELAIGRRAKSVSQHRDYFDRNRARMQYTAFEAAGIPTGSGAIESAIRRVINMRMKSNGMFWLEENAQGMLLLRSYLKAEHFDHLVDWSIASASAWWPAHAAIAQSGPCIMRASA